MLKAKHTWLFVRSRGAFTLVELSIVLVVLGLLVGGVLAGKSIIHAAELRSVSTEYNFYAAAFNSFRNKYLALPGDITNAQSIWGIEHATSSTCATQASTNARTCNGNGDGAIAWWIGSDESARAWQHLANAGLIEGSYTGVGAAPSSSFAPKMKFGSTNNWYVTTYTTAITGNTSAFSLPPTGNTFAVYGESSFVTFIPEDAWNIDTKMDDGKPNSGRILAEKGDATNPCTDRYGQAVAAADANAVYNITWPSIACDMMFVRAF